MERGQCIREQTLFTVYCKSGKDDIVVLPCERACQYVTGTSNLGLHRNKLSKICTIRKNTSVMIYHCGASLSEQHTDLPISSVFGSTVLLIFSLLNLSLMGFTN